MQRIAHGLVTSLGVTAVCLYDARAFPPEYLEIVAQRHTLAVADGAAWRNEQFKYAPA